MEIFILEDFEERIDRFREIFSGCNIDYTDNVKTAQSALGQKKYDLILLDRDLSNPHENGEDLAWEMMQNKLASDTPIILHTENARGQRVMKRYLSKYHSNIKQIPFKKLQRMNIQDILK